MLAAAVLALGLTALPGRGELPARPLLLVAETAPQRYDLWSMSGTADPLCLGETEPQEFDAVWSPDGTRIAYVSTTRDLRERHTDLWVMDADGRSRRQLTRSGQYVLAPSWSPDGKRVLFSTINRPLAGTPEFGIRYVDLDGGEGALGSGLWASLSPDGSKLLFTALDPKKNWEMTVQVAAADGSGPKPLLGKKTMMAAWSPDGKWIAYTGAGMGDQPDLFVAASDGSHRRQLTRTLESEVGPCWSPDGRLYFNRMTRDRPVSCRVWSVDPALKKLEATLVTRKDRMEITGPVAFWLLGPGGEPTPAPAPNP